MMQFEQFGQTFDATNSIKPVTIHKGFHGWTIFTPEGRLLDNFESAGPFIDFEAARRNAEANVGMAVNFE